MGTAKGKDLDGYNISLSSGKSTGMMEYQALKAAAAEVDWDKEGLTPNILYSFNLIMIKETPENHYYTIN